MKEGKECGKHCSAPNEREQRRWVPINSQILVCTVWADPLMCAQGEIKGQPRAYLFSCHSLFIFLRECLSPPWKLSSRRGWIPASSRYPLPLFPSTGITSACHHTRHDFFTWLLGTKFRSLFSEGKHFTHGVGSFVHIYPKSLNLKIAH